MEPRCLLAAVAGGLPDVAISKGIVSSTSANPQFDALPGPASVNFASAGTSRAPFSGVINSQGLRTGVSPVAINANLNNAEAGDTVRFAVTLENRSTIGSAFDVTLTDALPASVTFVPGSLKVYSGSGQAIRYADLSGSTDGSGLFTAGVRLDDPGTTSGSLAEPDHCGALDALGSGTTGDNIAVVFYDAVVGNPSGNSPVFSGETRLTAFAQSEGGANLSTSPADLASLQLSRIDLEVAKSVSDSTPIAGDIVTWTIDVTNNSATATTAATGVVVADVVPSGQRFVSGSASFPAGGSFDEGSGQWTVGGAINPGESRRLTIRTIAATSVESAAEFVDVELTSRFDTSTFREGDIVSYEIRLENNAEGATRSATGATVGGLLPSGLSLVSSSATAGSFVPATGVWDLSAVALAPGQVETLTVNAAVSPGTAGSVISLTGEVVSLTETDVDATTNNGSTTEDDDVRQDLTIRAASTTRTVSGRIFLDTNNDGINSGETGVTGITVRAYSADDTLVSSATSDAGGGYSLTGVTSEAIRLEFSGLANNQSVTTAQSPPASSTSVSSLAFLDAGVTSLTANLALYRPADNALYVTTCFVYSGQSRLDPTAEPAIIAFNADGTIKTTLATIAEVGATNGVAIHKSSGDQFVAAFQKRHSDVGPAGNSAIYRIDVSGTLSTFVRLDDFFGADSAGPYSHDPTNWFTDSAAFGTTGKIGLGDIDISQDGQFAYTINLATRQLIQIPIGIGSDNSPVDYVVGDSRTISAFPIPGNDPVAPTDGGIPTGLLGTDAADNIRPFALTAHEGLVYVGMVNSAETTGAASDLNAYVFVFDPASGQFQTTASVDFNLASRVTGGGWQSWTSDWNEIPKFYEASGDFFTAGRNQPWLTDIEFDNNGDMILGFRDRTGDEVGHMVGDPTGSDTDGIGGPDRYYHDTKGDILRLRQSTALTWSPEAGQSVGDNTEYYTGDEASFEPLAATLHSESAQGGLTLLPGYSDIATTAIDPESYWAGGIITLDNATGEQTDQLDVYSGSSAADIVTFGKNNGLGDLEYFENLSLEIGNRVWNDVNRNGRQEPGEPALANIDLQLVDVSDPTTPQLVGTTTTGANGEYYFNDSNVNYADGGAPRGLRPLTDYELRVASSEFSAGGTLVDFVTSPQDKHDRLIARTTRSVTGVAEFDTDANLTPDTPRNQRIDVLSGLNLAADGVRVLVLNAVGGFARVDQDQSVIFEFGNGITSGSFEYEVVDDRLDSDASGFDDNGDGNIDRAEIAFESGADGWTDHSLDLGFYQGNSDLSVTKYSDRQLVVSGDTVRFTVVVTNEKTSDIAASGVVLADAMPAGLTYVPATTVISNGTFDGISWTLANPLGVGESATLTYAAVVNAGTTGSTLVNAIQITAADQNDPDSQPGNEDGDRSEDDEDDAIVFVGTNTNPTVFNVAQVVRADQPDFDSSPGNNDHDESEDDEAVATFTLSTLINVFDFGDLPDVYQTLSGSGGPSHRRGTPTFLGVAVDDESNGIPTATAIGDGTDEDGIRFLTPLIPGTTASIEVTANSDGFLNAWADFDGDTVFDEFNITTIDGTTLPSPVNADDLALSAGVHVLSIAVPATAAGNIATRFRYTNDAMAALRAPGGQWLNGEVEDYLLRELGDRVWFDHNADGIFDATTEAGLAGVTVVLAADLDGDGTAETFTTTTDLNGFYGFVGLPSGAYSVTVIPPTSLIPTFDLDGGIDNTAAVTIADSDLSRLDVNFGYRGIGLIGDTVWVDSNANGIIESGESGLPGVAVVLTGDLNGDALTDITHTTTTNATGVYAFPDLVAGNYTVTLSPPAGATPTFDSDNIGTPNTSAVSLAIATVNRSQDFGYRGSLSIGDTVWVDLNGNGTFDTGEPPLGGVIVALEGDTNGDAVADVTRTATTNTAGTYSFTNLLPGTYVVTVTPPGGYLPTFDADGPATANQSSLTLTTSSRADQDFGYRGSGLIGDTVWTDTNANGIIDAGELPLPGIVVRLTADLNGDTIPDIAQDTVTNASGNYEFANLPPGDYIISAAQPTGTTPAFDGDGTGTPNTTAVVLTSGETNRDVDFGYQATSSGASGLIGDTVWLDANANGVFDTEESGLTGATVLLSGDIDGDGITDVSLTTTTGIGGLYEFTGLSAGIYTVAVVPPSGASPTFDADGVTTPNTTIVTLLTGQQTRSVDFGYQQSPETGVDLIVAKESNAAGDAAAVGSVVIYSVRLSNNGPADAVDAQLVDTLPAAFLSATWTAEGSGGTVFSASGIGNLSETISLPVGGFITYTVTAQLNAAFSGTVSNTATVTTTQTDVDLTNNQSTDILEVTPLTLTPENDPLPGEPFQIGARGMSHVSLVPFVVGTTQGIGTINGVAVDIADPRVFMVGFVCVDDRIIAVYDIPSDLDGQTLYFQSYESAPTPRVSNLVTANVGAARILVSESAEVSAVAEGSSTDSVKIVLSEAPTSDVVVGILNELPERLITGQSTLTFTPGNWNVPQSVNLSAVDDGLVNGDVKANVVFKVQGGSDPVFQSAFARTVSVTVADNDVLQRPGLTNSHTSTPSQQPLITWSSVPSANSYDIWLSPAKEISNPTFNINVLGTSFTPSQPLGIGRHVVWVRARTDSGQVSAWSTAASIDVTTAPVVSATTPGIDARTSISWTAVEGAVHYEVWVNNSTTSTSKVVYLPNQTSTSFTTSTLSFGVHSIWVRGVNQFGRTGDWSTATTTFVGPVLLSPGSTFSLQPEFTWTSPSGAASFEIYLQAGATVIRQAGLTTTSFTPSAPLDNNTSYRWWVRGLATNGTASRWSGPAIAHIGGRPIFKSPGDSTSADGQPIFAWGTVEGTAVYDLFVSRLDVATTAFRVSTLTSSSYQHTSRLAAGSYRAWVRAISSTGVLSPWSTPVDFVVV